MKRAPAWVLVPALVLATSAGASGSISVPFSEDFSGATLDPAWSGSSQFALDTITEALDLDHVGDGGEHVRTFSVDVGTPVPGSFTVSSDYELSSLGTDNNTQFGILLLDGHVSNEGSNIGKWKFGGFRRPGDPTKTYGDIVKDADGDGHMDGNALNVPFNLSIEVTLTDAGGGLTDVRLAVTLTNLSTGNVDTGTLTSEGNDLAGATGFGYRSRQKTGTTNTTAALDNFRIAPEPGALALLALGGVGMLFRRRGEVERAREAAPPAKVVVPRAPSLSVPG
jgi:hypothetical protein